jgi:hypothetical protein
MVGRIGNSITTITKEVAQQRAAKQLAPAGAVIASVTVTETKAEVIMPDETPAAT